MNKNKEKIIIAVVTIIILVAIFLAFILSNSQKTPSDITVQSNDGKKIEAVRFGYQWKVFGKNIISDSVNPYEFNYSTTNTLVSKPYETLKVSADEKFSVEEANYCVLGFAEAQEASYRLNDSFNNMTITLPNMEGTYIYALTLEYAKGKAEYGFKVVVTDDNVYEVNELIKYKDTEITDYSHVDSLLKAMPYGEKIDGITIDDSGKSISIRYDVSDMQKKDLLNNSVALFVLIPELDHVTYVLNSGRENNEIYYNRTEINHLYNRNISDYATDIESWTKEVIYKEASQSSNSMVEAYEEMINTLLLDVPDDELGDCFIVNMSEELLNEYERKTLLNLFSDKYKNIISTSKELTTKNASKLKVEVTNDTEMIVNMVLTTVTGNEKSKKYVLKMEDGNMIVQEYSEKTVVEEPQLTESGEEVTE